MPVTEIEVSEGGGVVAATVDAASVGAASATLAVVPPADTVFSVLAGQARGRTTSELRTTALGCAVNAGLLFWQHPSLSWLASAFVAASAYGAWGLFDRAMIREASREKPDPGSVTFLRGFRAVAVGVGLSAAAWAVFRFMAVALGGWQH